MNGPALPSFRLLLAGALAAGIWVVNSDHARVPRPPEPVKESRAAVAVRPAVPRPPEAVRRRKPVETVRTEPVRRPSEPVKSQNAVATVLPATVVRPPRRPSQGTTGSVAGAAGPARLYRTSARVNLRGRAEDAAPVISVLEAGLEVRQLARSGGWRLVVAAGRKGWVHGDYLTEAVSPSPRPRAPVPPRRTAAAAEGTPPLRRP